LRFVALSTTPAAGFDRWEAPIRDGLRRMRDRGELQDDTAVDRLALGTLAACKADCCSPRPSAMSAPSMQR
jgi:hypothetical protein